MSPDGNAGFGVGSAVAGFGSAGNSFFH